MESGTVDAIVTDPPYGLSFMGKRWDYDVPTVEVWAECLRVLKPGGHLLAFAGTRTQHRMAVRIEDAGFEIRDMIAWVYGSGFPKSLNVANAIHDAAIGQPQSGAKPSSKNHGKFKDGCSEENETGRDFGAGPGQFMAESGGKSERELGSQAQPWQGWGTALKPALEPITVARKPLVGTVAENVLAYGTGAINVDGCRVPHAGEKLGGGNNSADVDRTGKHEGWQRPWMQDREAAAGVAERSRASTERSESLGRWPANLIHDGSEDVLASFPQAPGQMATASSSSSSRKNQNTYGAMARGSGGAEPRADTGSAARFFYCAKASKTDRGEDNNHPTVKPTDLMRYLCRLVTPPGGVVLDPFMGSGSTGKAAILEGFRFIGVERDPAYLEIARRRIGPAPEPDLFSLPLPAANPA